MLDGDLKVLDKVRAIVGGIATMFRGDLRVATNVLRPDGARDRHAARAGSGVRCRAGPETGLPR